MLEIAKSESADECIEYICMDMSAMSSLTERFDLIYSSLAFHYVENFEKLCSDIYVRVNPGGFLLFSQEHPIITATADGGGHFNKDKNGVKVSYSFSNYCESGFRKSTWLVQNVEKYHRPMGEIVTTLAKTGFIIRELVEPVPETWALEKNPEMKKEFIKPNFLIIRAQKSA